MVLVQAAGRRRRVPIEQRARLKDRPQPHPTSDSSMGTDEGRWEVDALLKGRPFGQGFVWICAYVMVAVVAPCGISSIERAGPASIGFRRFRRDVLSPTRTA